jgi:hypothetical protein
MLVMIVDGITGGSFRVESVDHLCSSNDLNSSG